VILRIHSTELIAMPLHTIAMTAATATAALAGFAQAPADHTAHHPHAATSAAAPGAAE
jgi:hypothetical protein